MIKTKILIGVLALLMILYATVSRRYGHRKLYKQVVIAFAIYCCVLIWITILSRTMQDEYVSRFRIKPLFVFDYGLDGSLAGLKIGNINEQSWLNILLFVPMGYLVPLMIRSRSIWKTLGIGFLASASVELIQYLTRRGWGDLDDLILNMIGTVIGYGFIRLLLCFEHRRENDDG